MSERSSMTQDFKCMMLRKFFPIGSRRRRFLDIIFESVKVIYSEGLGDFANIAINRLKSSELFNRSYRPKLAKEIQSLTIPLFDMIAVSIIIPVYNKPVYTYNCLKSIMENTSRDTSYEIIIVDNGSDKETRTMLQKMSNVQVIRNEENLGFVEACNQGALNAFGEYLLFLNNDTMVTEGWLAALIKIIKTYPDAGAVGAQLIYPNGVLQEAGGIIWRDGSAWNYGKFDNPKKPQYSYLREVDYCSGACLMVKKSIFEKIGGFDLRYSPAYCEDADLCFSIRRMGYKVFYQPKSRVFHFEGATAGRKVYSGFKKYQISNSQKFREKWALELEEQNIRRNNRDAFLARDRRKGKTMLVIDHHVPTHDKDAGSFFMFNLLRTLSFMGYRVVFWPDNLYPEEPYTGILQQKGIEVIFDSVNFKKYMKKYGNFFEAAILTRTHIAIRYIDIVKRYIPKIVYHAPDLEYIREYRRAEIEEISKRTLKKIRERELYLFRNSNLITTVSPKDGDIIHEEIPDAKVMIIPHPIDKITATKTPFEDRNGILFVGSMHPPNADAILYFARDIMPHLQKKLPNVRFYAVGSNPSKEVKALESDTIVVTGFVKDLLPYFENCRIYVAPLRYGAGVKGKIIEAMSYSLPIVTTSIGAEGLNLSHGENILIADNREDIIKCIELLYHDKDLWHKIRENAFKHVEENFSQKIFTRQVKQMKNFLEKE